MNWDWQQPPYVPNGPPAPAPFFPSVSYYPVEPSAPQAPPENTAPPENAAMEEEKRVATALIKETRVFIDDIRSGLIDGCVSKFISKLTCMPTDTRHELADFMLDYFSDGPQFVSPNIIHAISPAYAEAVEFILYKKMKQQ